MKCDSNVVGGAAQNFDYLSVHRYDNPEGFAVNPYENQRFYEAHREMIAKSDNPKIKLFCSEWNAQSSDLRTGLHADGYLNCVELESDVVEITSPALFLRHKSATAWDNALINFNNAGCFPAPNYVVMKLWRDSYAPNLLSIISDSPELSVSAPIINATATKSEDGKTIFLRRLTTCRTMLNTVLISTGTLISCRRGYR